MRCSQSGPLKRNAGAVRYSIFSNFVAAPSSSPVDPSRLIDTIRQSPVNRVKVAVTDIDGVLRGKFISKEKFLSAAAAAPEGGFGFCDVVFGWDSSDACYDNAKLI